MSHDYMIFKPENPYKKFKEQFDQMDIITKDLEIKLKERDAKVYEIQNEFNKIFIPDQTQFNDLHTELKEAIKVQKGNAVLDSLLYKLALIYRRWIPLKEYLYALNTDPELLKLFEALEKMIQKIEKEENGKKEATHTGGPATDGPPSNVSRKHKGTGNSSKARCIPVKRVQTSGKTSGTRSKKNVAPAQSVC